MSIRLVPALIAVSLSILLASGPAAAQSGEEPQPEAPSAEPRDAQSDDVVVAILDVLLARGIIEQAEYDELLAMAHERIEDKSDQISLIEGSLARLRAPDVQVEGGKPGKLAFRSADGNWSAELRGFVQARFADINSQVDGQSGTNFSVPRGRLSMSGNSGAPNVKYKLEIDASTSTSLDTSDPPNSDAKSAIVKDAYVDYGVTEDGSVRFGQYKFPFGLEELTSDTSLDFADRSLASRTFAPGREPGAGWMGSVADGAVEYQLAASNGDGEGEPNTADNSTIQTGDGLRYGARLAWFPLGSMKYESAAFQTLDGGSRMVLGVAYMSDKDARLLNSSVAGTAGADADTLDLEFQWMIGPFSVLAEYYDRSTSLAGAPDVDDHGYTLQAGWFLVPNE
ncbi:MAG TPA: porin, partial [Planctomycetota bacterium]|nr:porin [Planctomycetota bacterium]